MMVAMTLVIDCDQCAMRHSDQCQDCVVSFLCDEPPSAVIVDAAEERAIRMLSRAGLVPVLRHRRQADCA